MVICCNICGRFKGKNHTCQDKSYIINRNKSEWMKEKIKIAHKNGKYNYKINSGVFKKGHYGYGKGIPRSKEVRNKIHETKQKNKWHPSEETIKKMLSYSSPSSIELKMINIIQKLNLPYKFVGNGQVIIGGKCPDFVNTNGEKIAIEVFFKNHKEMCKKIPINIWKNEREKIFKEYGWKLIFLDEKQVNEDYIMRCLL